MPKLESGESDKTVGSCDVNARTAPKVPPPLLPTHRRPSREPKIWGKVGRWWCGRGFLANADGGR